MSLRPFAPAMLCLAASLLLTSCAASDGSSASDTSESAATNDASIVGSWESDSVDVVRLFVQSGSFSFAGLCPGSGQWVEEDGKIVPTVGSIPDIGGCPEAWTVEIGNVAEFRLLDNDKLLVVDEAGHEEQLSRFEL